MKKIIYLIIFLLSLSTCLFAQSSTILITEILADPTPSKGLPEREYLELYNSSETKINLKGYVISINASNVVLQDFNVEPKSYVIVCKKEYELEFQKYGQVLPISTLSLLNDGSTITLKNPKNEVLQIINYNMAWYTPKFTEGYALEMIDLQKNCLGKENWASSTASLAGTPGKENAISKTLNVTNGPELLKYEIDNKIVTLTYSQNLDANTLNNLQNIYFENSNIKISKNLSQALFSPVLKFELSTTLASQDKIAFRVKSPSNCLATVGPDNEIVFYNLPKAKKGDLYISEVMYDPKSDQSEFFELYNASDKSLNIKGFSVNVKENETTSLRILSNSDLIFKSKSYIVFAKEKEVWQTLFPKQKNDFYAMQSFPALNNDGGVINLISPDSLIYDTFKFSDAFHSKNLTNTSGVSLERISFKSPATLAANIHSAAQVNGFSTPALPNSSVETTKTENVFSLDHKTLVANDPQLSKISLKYALNELDYQATINIFNKEGKLCRRFILNQSLGINGQFEWNGTDNSGVLLPVGYYFFQIELRNSSKTYVQRLPVIVGSN